VGLAAVSGGAARRSSLSISESRPFSKDLDKALAAMGVYVLRTPVRAPKVNSVCERFGGTLRRECLDYLIPINERHLKMTVKECGTQITGTHPGQRFRQRLQTQIADRMPCCEGFRARRVIS
jgi:transposase InsO family protein